MRAYVVAAALLLAPPAAHAEEFETKAQGAIKVGRADDLVWPFTAACDKGDDVQQRQCRTTRDRRAKELAGATLWVIGDQAAVVAGAWNAQKKSVPVTVAGCVHCGGVDVDGHVWNVVVGAPRLDGGRLRGGTLYDNARPFADEAAAVQWTKTLATSRFELLVKVPDKRRVQLGGKDALALDLVAWRVVNVCDGSIVLSSVPSARGEMSKKECGATTTGGGSPVRVPSGPDGSPDALTPSMVQDAMRPVVTAARACAGRMKMTGRAKLDITINGDGTIAKHEQTGDFVGTPMGKCIDDAMRSAVFPKTKKPTTKIGFPIVL